jgi:hypothetical protein
MLPIITRHRLSGFAWALLAAPLWLAAAPRAAGLAPVLFRQPFHESPVHGGPDDLLSIGGSRLAQGDRVVYRSTEQLDVLPTHPAEVPGWSGADLGLADVVSYANVPNALVVRLPPAIRGGRVYALWVVTAQGEWSAAVRINDPRPLWASPAFAYQSARIGTLPRYLKIVGRNLRPTPGAATEIRLEGPTNIVLRAQSAGATLDDYAARAALPARLPAGVYRIMVRCDGSNWVPLERQSFEVRPDPPAPREFHVEDAAFGKCAPNDGVDDTGCIRRAVAAAARAGGGEVRLGPGIWTLSERALDPPDGIVLPRGVSLAGAGPRETILSQAADGTYRAGRATFTLLGHNVVRNIDFRDERVYSPDHLDTQLLRLGPSVRTADTPGSVDDVVITNNTFDRPSAAIGNAGLAIRRLIVSGNEFGAYRIGVELSGNRYDVTHRFAIEDSVIADNRFEPGSYFAPQIRQGTIASELGAATRVDFSGNTANGASRRHLYPGGGPHGWRAAFFWHMNDNLEMMLVSQNSATCTGDEVGDGEAISYDNNANTFALPSTETVLEASADGVTVAGPLVGRQNDRDVNVDDYYLGHWIQVGEGPGLGQARKITAYARDPVRGSIAFHVEPAWDVVPEPGRTRINIGREYWQVLTIANTVDHRKPLCAKSNPSRVGGGLIGMWAQSADSVMAGNVQHDTDGIVFRQHYNAEERGCAQCARETSYIDFLEIRDNLIDGEYAWDDDCSSSGVMGSLAAAPTSSAPATVGYGLSISHNLIRHADGRQGGAISMVPTWFEGPAPHRWPLVADVLIDHNVIEGFDAPPGRACPGTRPHERTAISLGTSSLVRGAVLYANTCADARRPVDSREDQATRVCPAEGTAACGCAPARTAPR